MPGTPGLKLRMDFALSPDLRRLVQFMPNAGGDSEVALARRDGERLYFVRDGATIPERVIPGTVAEHALNGETSRITAPDYRGILNDAAASPVDGTGWVVIVKSARRSVERAALYGALHAAAAAAGLGLFVLLLLAQRASRRAVETERRSLAEKTLLAQAIEQAAESVVITDAAGDILYVNPAFTRVTGYSREEAVGRNPRVLKSGKHDAGFYEEMWSVLSRHEVWHGRLVNRKKDGTLFEEEASIGPVRGEDGRVAHYVAVKRDASAETALEQQLRHAQKMDAVGRLAGGVAHDFNNILTSILGNAEMAAMQVPENSQVAEDLKQILKAGKLAADLTRQLLVFSRKQIVEPVSLDMNKAVHDFERMLRRTLGEDIKLVLDLASSPLWVKIDPSQFDQIILNLAVNARDAMPQGGRLVIAAAPVEFSRTTAFAIASIPSGRYARLRVIDEGVGMEPAVMDHIFEPFFTTKEKGRGTGLGLSTVFGIVKQAEGYVTVDSEPGRGSVFSVFLPLTAAPGEVKSVVETRSGAMRAGETILLAEDQDEVRVVAERALRSAGYVVLPCRNGVEALAVEAAHRGDIHLLLTDVVMPGMGAKELANALQQRRPGARTLFISGYTDEKVESGGVLKPGVDLLQKPFTISTLLSRVRAALEKA